jgi:hypothetical protein
VSGGSAVATTEPTSTTRSDERSSDDCRRLVDHTVALADAERPPEHKLTADERSRLATQLRDRWAASCKTMTSGGYQCALAARTLAELDACGA